MNQNQHPTHSDDEKIRRSGTGGPIPAEDLSEEALRDAERLGDGSPAVEPRTGDHEEAPRE